MVLQATFVTVDLLWYSWGQFHQSYWHRPKFDRGHYFLKFNYTIKNTPNLAVNTTRSYRQLLLLMLYASKSTCAQGACKKDDEIELCCMAHSVKVELNF